MGQRAYVVRIYRWTTESRVSSTLLRPLKSKRRSPETRRLLRRSTKPVRDHPSQPLGARSPQSTADQHTTAVEEGRTYVKIDAFARRDARCGGRGSCTWRRRNEDHMCRDALRVKVLQSEGTVLLFRADPDFSRPPRFFTRRHSFLTSSLRRDHGRRERPASTDRLMHAVCCRMLEFTITLVRVRVERPRVWRFNSSKSVKACIQLDSRAARSGI